MTVVQEYVHIYEKGLEPVPDYPEIGTGWEQVRDPDPTLRPPYFLSTTEATAHYLDEPPVIETGWEQTQYDAVVLRPLWFLSTTLYSQDIPVIETGWEYVGNPDPVLRPLYFISDTFFEDIEILGWDQVEWATPIVYRPLWFLSNTLYSNEESPIEPGWEQTTIPVPYEVLRTGYYLSYTSDEAIYFEPAQPGRVLISVTNRGTVTQEILSRGTVILTVRQVT